MYLDDEQEWEVLKREFLSSDHPLVWDASSGLDLFPLLAVAGGRAPGELADALAQAVLLMSDYDSTLLDTLKLAYDQLDFGTVIVLQTTPGGNQVFGRFSCNSGSTLPSSPLAEVSIEQMIPLQVWTASERERFQHHYVTHPGVALHPVPDDDWHLVYIELHVAHENGALTVPVLFMAMDNLLVYREVFLAYGIALEAFFAVRVGGKSGSWDQTHDFARGQLPRAIAEAPAALRPRFWALEESVWCADLPDTFRAIGAIPGMGFGAGSTVYHTGWR